MGVLNWAANCRSPVSKFDRDLCQSISSRARVSLRRSTPRLGLLVVMSEQPTVFTITNNDAPLMMTAHSKSHLVLLIPTNVYIIIDSQYLPTYFKIPQTAR